MTTLRQWTRGLPDSTVSRQWYFAGTALVLSAVAVVALLAFGGGSHGSEVAFAVHALVVVVAGCALVSPLPSAIATGIFLQIVAVHPELRSPVVVFAVLTVVVILALVRSPLFSGVCTVVLWYLALTAIPIGDLLPDDLESAAILAALFLASWTGALVLRESLISRRTDSERFKQKIEEERERTIKALHGSVAASLTSVVLRSESIAMKATGASRQDSLLIAEDARRAMHEVRELIRFMKTDDEFDFASSAMREPFTLYENLSIIIGKLRSHGFTVIESGITEESLGGFQLRHGYTVFRELKTNILKYADRSKPVIVAAVNEDDAVTIAIQNDIDSGKADLNMTTDIGLKEASDLVELDGGSLVYNSKGRTWRCELSFPFHQHD